MARIFDLSSINNNCSIFSLNIRILMRWVLLLLLWLLHMRSIQYGGKYVCISNILSPSMAYYKRLRGGLLPPPSGSCRISNITSVLRDFGTFLGFLPIFVLWKSPFPLGKILCTRLISSSHIWERKPRTKCSWCSQLFKEVSEPPKKVHSIDMYHYNWVTFQGF